jgi:hypothetical protein
MIWKRAKIRSSSIEKKWSSIPARKLLLGLIA